MSLNICGIAKSDCEFYRDGYCSREMCMNQTTEDRLLSYPTDMLKLNAAYMGLVLKQQREILRQLAEIKSAPATPERRTVKLCAKQGPCSSYKCGFCINRNHDCEWLHCVKLTDMEYAALVAQMREKIR